MEARKRDTFTARWLIVAGGSAVRLVLGFLVSVIVVRALGPAEYGVFVLLGALAAIGGGLADFGLSDSAVPRLVTQPDERTVTRTFFWLRVTLAAIVAMLGATVFTLVGWPAPGLAVALVAVGLVATAVTGSAATLLQVDNRFGVFAALPVINSGVSLLLAVALVATGAMSLVAALLWLGIVPTVVAAVIAFRQLSRQRRPGLPAFVNVRRWFKESVWIGVANNLSVLSVSLDVVVIGAMLGPVAVGLYGLALSLAGKADVLSGSLYSVLLPAAARRDSLGGRAHFVRGGVAAVIVVAGAIAAGPFIGLVYGPDYRAAAPLVIWLLVAVGLDILVAPLQPVAIAAGRTRLLAWSEGVRCAVVIASLVVLVPAVGPVGAALARILGRLAYIATVAYPAISSYKAEKTDAARSSA